MNTDKISIENKNQPSCLGAVSSSCLIVVKKDKYDDWWYECLSKKYERYNFR